MQNNSSHQVATSVDHFFLFLREPPVSVLTSVVQLFESSIENHDSAPLNISESDIINININIHYLDIKFNWI
jgi:hypothetical protein